MIAAAAAIAITIAMSSWPWLASTAPVIVPDRTEVPDDHDEPNLPWNVIVWNDPINLMVYVTFVLQKLFGYPREVAEKLMLQVHYDGRAVVSSGADVGVAFDGDGDRMLAVDAAGNEVDGDQILAVLALHLGVDLVAVTRMTNLGFHRLMGERGIRVLTTDVGDRYVLEEMRRSGCNVGGEQSGHIVFARHATTGDGMLTGLKLLELLDRRRRPLAELAGEDQGNVAPAADLRRVGVGAARARSVEPANRRLDEHDVATRRRVGQTRHHSRQVCGQARFADIFRRPQDFLDQFAGHHRGLIFTTGNARGNSPTSHRIGRTVLVSRPSMR